MRMRKKKWAVPFIEQYSNIAIALDENSSVLDTSGYKKILVEIGCGKGDFICGIAKLYPDNLCIAVEKDINAAAVALKKIVEQDLNNIKLFIGDGKYLLNVLPDHNVSCIYLNHSDPWPKKAHEKRRLTYISFLQLYEQLLKKDGQLIQKTDNQHFFEYSLISITNYHFSLQEVHLNYDVTQYLDCDVKTEYEEKFLSLGQPIYKAVYNRKHEE